MDNYTTDYVTLLDENGGEHRFEVLDILEDDKEKFYALLPERDREINTPYTDETYGYYIFQEISSEKDQILSEVEDPVKLEKLSKIFEKRFDHFW